MKRQGYLGTTAYDYHAHVSALERTPSILGDAPRYPNLSPLFDGKNAAAYCEVKKLPQFQEKVEVIEFHEEKSDDSGRKEELKRVDVETDGFIEQKPKGFELCKWNTFKAL